MDMQRKKLASAVSACVLAWGLTGAALAATPTETPRQSETSPATEQAKPPQVATATQNQILVQEQLLNQEVSNPQGEKLGVIKDVILDKATGRVNYVVLSHGGFLAMGEKRTPVPFEALKQTKEGQYMLDMSKDKLAQAPTLEPGKMAQLESPEWNRQTYAYYGMTYAGPAAASFAQLDINGDGYISRQEAQMDPQLEANFSQADQNRDDRINRAEFSAFEAQSEQMPSQPQMQQQQQQPQQMPGQPQQQQ